MEGFTPDARLHEVLEIVSCSRAAVLILQIPTQVIVAASPGAHELLDGIAQPLIGRSLDDFTEGHPCGAMQLLAIGRICGYETVQVLKGTGQRRRLWIRALSQAQECESRPARQVLAVLVKEEAQGRQFVPWKDDEALSPVIGSTDARLIIDRISSEVHESLGFLPTDVIGVSLLTLMAPEDLAEVLSALARLTTEKEGVTLRVRVVGANLVPAACHLVLLPLEPAPSVAFALLTDEGEHEGGVDGRAVSDLIARLTQGIRGAITSQPVATADLHPDVDLGHLSSRELEIVSLLMAGDRVSSIARALFLSEGTIRNHLSSVFGKLGVGTQQQLIQLLRPLAKSEPNG
jgi:DNA-binding CsgD family transcriptional regulator